MKFAMLLCFIGLAVGSVAGQTSSCTVSVNGVSVTSLDGITNVLKSLSNIVTSCLTSLIQGLGGLTSLSLSALLSLVSIVTTLIGLITGILFTVISIVGSLAGSLTTPPPNFPIANIKNVVQTVCNLLKSVAPVLTSLSGGASNPVCGALNCLLTLVFNLLITLISLIAGLVNNTIKSPITLDIPLPTLLQDLVKSLVDLLSCILESTLPQNCIALIGTVENTLNCLLPVLQSAGITVTDLNDIINELSPTTG